MKERNAAGRVALAPASAAAGSPRGRMIEATRDRLMWSIQPQQALPEGSQRAA